ncbi:MAG TPA: hypothetical protein VE287_09465 [Actinopolymorphaceae bacterium]|nr:hypothetical protein [Actinopolymorphaceae bacterium]
MLVLTRETGQSVRDADGVNLGRLRDLTSRIGAEHPTVDRLAVGSRHRLTHLLPWTAVAAFERSGVRLRPDVDTADFLITDSAVPLEPDELLLVRDVLDTQIVDTAGHRLSRVSDVLLTRGPDGRLELVAVDVGFGAVLRRLGLGWWGDRLPEEAVDWRDLHLTSSRGHQVQLDTTCAAVHRLDARSLAELLTRLDLGSATDVMQTVGPERAAGAVAQTHPDVGSRLMLQLPPDDADEVLDQLPAESSERYRHVLSSRTPLTRRRFSRLRGWRLHRPNHRPGSSDARSQRGAGAGGA